jgi:23S rRNA (uracil1939-C5)-methyltransferase
VENVHFIQGDVGRAVDGLVREGERFGLLLADPPRTGAPGLARWAVQLGVRKVVYVACDPTSLARDGKALVEAGFRPEHLQLADMFPQTRHVESVLSFVRR